MSSKLEIGTISNLVPMILSLSLRKNLVAAGQEAINIWVVK